MSTVIAPEVAAIATKAAEGRAPQFPALTGIRFPLAIWVMVHHLSGNGKMLDATVKSLPFAMQSMVQTAWVAVNLFFLLSGFVLAHTYARTEWNRSNVLRYSVRRYGRVYPVYLLSLVIMLPWIVQYVVLPDHAPLLMSYGLLLQGWTPPQVHWNTPAWSLSCEMFFYLLFPFTVLLLRMRNWRVMLLFGAASLALPSVVRELGMPQSWKPILYLADFLLGVCAAGLFRDVERMRGWWFYVPAAIAVVVLTAAPYLPGSSARFDVFIRIANAAMVLGLALGGGYLVRVLSTKPLVELGKATYAMYILHIPVLWWFQRYGLHRTESVAPHIAALGYLTIVIVVSILVARYFEEPLNERIRAWTARIP